MSSPEFYRNALAYDIAFSDRNFSQECDFLEWCLRTFGAVSPHARSFVELACGPARHAQEFAKRGWRGVGVDLSADMVEYAQECAARANTNIELAQADICDYQLTRPVALAANLMESLSHLVTNEQVVQHLRAVAANLVDGGIFVIEMAHPSTLGRDNLPNTWTSRSTDTLLFEHAPFTKVDVLFGSDEDPYDWVTQQWLVTTRLTIHTEGQPTRVVEHHHPHRWYLAQELRALIDLSGAFTQTWWFGNMLLPPPPLDSSDNSERMIVVLRK